MRSRRRLLDALTIGSGIILFVIMVTRAGTTEVIARTGSLGFGFIGILAISGLRVFTRAAAWRLALPPTTQRVGLGELLTARLIGDAAGHLTPAGPLVAEPSRIAALGKRVPIGTSLHALAIETITYSLSSFLVVLAGIVVMLGSFALSRQLREAGLVAGLAIVFILALTGLVLVRRWALLSGLGEWARRVLHVVGFSKRWKRYVRHLRSFETDVFEFYRNRQQDFVKMAGLEVAFHVLGVLETWLTLSLVGFEPTMLIAFVLEATNRAVNFAFSFVPARVGVDEAGSGLLAEVLGIGATAGVTVALVRKARVLVWTAVGMILLAIKRR